MRRVVLVPPFLPIVLGLLAPGCGLFLDTDPPVEATPDASVDANVDADVDADVATNVDADVDAAEYDAAR